MLNLNSIMIGASDPKKLAEFYQEVLDQKPDGDGEWFGFDAGSCYLNIGAHDKVKGKAANPERVILNFETDEVEEEFERIKELEGVVVVAKPYHPNEMEEMTIATLADPEGNYFQLMTPWV